MEGPLHASCEKEQSACVYQGRFNARLLLYLRQLFRLIRFWNVKHTINSLFAAWMDVSSGLTFPPKPLILPTKSTIAHGWDRTWVLKLLVHAKTPLFVTKQYLRGYLRYTCRLSVEPGVVVLYLPVICNERVSIAFSFFKFHPIKLKAAARHFIVVVLR